MKRIAITKAFLVIIIIVSLLAGCAAALFLGPQLSKLTGIPGAVIMSETDYEDLVHIYAKYRKVERIWNQLESEFYTTVDQEALETGLLKGLVSGLGDPYSAYYTQEEYEDIMISLTGEYDGIGVTMTAGDNGYIEIFGVTKGSPAEKAGVSVGDFIYKVNGVEYGADDMDLAASVIRGKAGTAVEITFLSGNFTVTRTIMRASIIADTVEYEVLDDNIGYIHITGFENGTFNDVKAALDALKSTDKLVIDMRDNPGGLVDIAVHVADLFMDKAALMYTENHDGVRQYYSTSSGREWTKPFVVLVNENTASAAEIVTAGFKDNDAAKVVGTQTFGKGIIQSVDRLSDGTSLKLTKWQYFSPNGTPIHKTGVTPDVVVELMPEDYDADGNLTVDRQLSKAIELLK